MVLVFSDKDKKPWALSHGSFTALNLVGCKRTHTAVRFVKSRGVDPSGVVQPFMDWVGNGGVDINWNVSPVLSPYTMMRHRGEFLLRV